MGEQTEKPAKKPQNKAKLIIYVIIIVGAAGGVLFQLQKRAKYTQYNQIIETQINNQEFEKAASQLEQMLPNVSGKLETEVRKSLVDCYKQIANDPSRPLKEGAAFLKKAHALDPNSLSDQEKQMLEMGSK